MSQLVALSLSIGVLGAVWTFLCLGPLTGYLIVWAGFIAWGCFFHSGGDTAALTKTIAGNVYGAIVGWIALLIIAHVSFASLGAVWSSCSPDRPGIFSARNITSSINVAMDISRISRDAARYGGILQKNTRLVESV